MSRRSEEILARLLGGGDPERIEAHIAEFGEEIRRDPELAEALELAPFIAKLESRRGDADGLGAEAIERQWSKISERIDEEIEAETQAKPSTESSAGDWVADFRRWFASGRRPMAFSAAILVLLVLGLAQFFYPRTIAELVFVAEGSAVVAEASGALEDVGSGIHRRELKSGASVKTAAGGGILRYTDQAEILLSGGTSVRLADKRGFELDDGAVWVDVTKGRGNFFVSTAEARIRVTGTSFGVARSGGVTRVAVTEGSVEVAPTSGVGGVFTLGAGDAIEVGEGSGAPAIEKADSTEPAWLSTLRSQAEAVSVGPLVPSVTSGRD